MGSCEPVSQLRAITDVTSTYAPDPASVRHRPRTGWRDPSRRSPCNGCCRKQTSSGGPRERYSKNHGEGCSQNEQDIHRWDRATLGQDVPFTLVPLVVAWFLDVKWTVAIEIIFFLLHDALIQIPLSAVDTRINCMNKSFVPNDVAYIVLCWHLRSESQIAGHRSGFGQEVARQRGRHHSAHPSCLDPRNLQFPRCSASLGASGHLRPESTRFSSSGGNDAASASIASRTSPNARIT